jgi:hypothetical protein|nr:MAG TPA: hypothetical protein [Caudoviricetes sp.]
MTSYKIIYDRFKLKIEDMDLNSLCDSDQNDMLLGYLNTALAYIELDKLKIKSDLSLKNDEEKVFTDDLYNSEIEVLALYMIVAWYEPKVNSLEHTLLFMGTKDEKWTNQKDHYKVTKDIQESYRIKARKYFRNYAYKTHDYKTGDES